MPFDRKTLVFPDSTRFEEYEIVTDGDVVVSDDVSLGFGIRTKERIFIGERAQIRGNLNADKDIMIDSFSKIGGDVESGGNVYLGEKVLIDGKLYVKGDLDVGNDVEIRKGFEAKGLISIRSPIPLIIYIFIYIAHLLKLGKSEEVERIMQELEQESNPIPVSKKFVFIPSGATIGTDSSKTPHSIKIGCNCKVVGNFDTGGDVKIGEDSLVYGSLSGSTIFVGSRAKIHGNISASGAVTLGENSKVVGNIYADVVFMPRSAVVEGTIMAKKGVVFSKVKEKEIKEKLKRFNAGVDVADEVGKLME